jgi:teichuronic acid biosynthesis protein TuaE
MSTLPLPRQPKLNMLFNLMVIFAVLGPTLGIPMPGFKMTFFRLAFILLAAGLILRWVDQQRLESFHMYPVRWFTGFFAFWFAYAVLSLTWVVNMGMGIKYVVFLFTMLLLCLSFPFFVKSEKNLEQTSQVLFGVFSLIVVYGLVEAVTFWHLPSSRYFGEDSGDPTSFFSNQNDFATAITLGLPFLATAMYMIPMRRKLRTMVYIIGVIALCCLFVTGSRSNSGFALPLAFLTWLAILPFSVKREDLNRKNITKGIVLVLVAAIITVGLTSTLLSDKTRSKLGTTLGVIHDLRQPWNFQDDGQQPQGEEEPASGDKSIAIRKYLIMNGLHFLRNSHYMGVGAGNIEALMKGAPGVEGKTNMHNWWAEVLVNFGVPIFVMYMGLYFWLLYRLWRLASLKQSPRISPWIRWGAVASFISLIGYFFGGMSPSTAIHFTPMWVVYGFALAVIATGEREIGRNREKSA